MQTTKTTAIVCSFDEALSGAPQDVILRYVRERDMSIIQPYIEGKTVTTFLVRPIPGSLFDRYVQGGANEYDQMARAFRAGIVSAENLLLDDGSPDGTMKPLVTFLDEAKPDQLPSEELCYQVPAAVRYEVGAYAMQRSFLPRLSGARFHAPLSSARVWEMLGTFQRADQKSTPATAPTTEPQSNATEVAPETHRAATG